MELQLIQRKVSKTKVKQQTHFASYANNLCLGSFRNKHDALTAQQPHCNVLRGELQFSVLFLCGKDGRDIKCFELDLCLNFERNIITQGQIYGLKNLLFVSLVFGDFFRWQPQGSALIEVKLYDFVTFLSCSHNRSSDGYKNLARESQTLIKILSYSKCIIEDGIVTDVVTDVNLSFVKRTTNELFVSTKGMEEHMGKWWKTLYNLSTASW